MEASVSSVIDPFENLVRKLSLLTDLVEDDLAELRKLPLRIQQVGSGAALVSEGQLASECCLLLSGYACRHKVARNGGRQIVSFHLAGDLLDIQHLLFRRADHNVQAITAASLGFIPIAALRDLIARRPALGTALWRDSLVDASVFREWVLNVGRRDAKTRIAHMLCEFAARAEAAGLGSPSDFTLPMTQEDIADATGLTAVHVNRMLRILTDEGSLTRNGRRARIVDWTRMRRTADFSPDYLHLAA
jgi:CRP-like cAMP-binding protein